MDNKTSVDEIYKSNIRVWSDNQNFHISNSPDLINFNLDIYDITGKLLSIYNIKSEGDITTISNLGYKNGFYLIKIKDDKNNIIKTQKIILKR